MNNVTKLPDCVDSRCGCKVSWKTYKKREDAETASVYAKERAELFEAKGYDFGFMVPGTISPVHHPVHGDCFEVVFP